VVQPKTASSPPRADPRPQATTTTAAPQPGWTPLSTVATGVAVDQRSITTSDGARITMIRFRAGQVRFALHAGTEDPPTGGLLLGTAAAPAVSPAERPLLLAAFNGGFKVSAHAGGVEVDGHVLTTLVAGMASLVIDADGTARVGVWGQTVPTAGEAVASVRQNLPPLVVGGQASASISDVGAWGSTLHGVAFQARSALGQDPVGDLIYVATMGALPIDLATALVAVGATIAMELDINPEWVQADVAAAPGAALSAVVPGQNQPADRYLLGWTRDFVSVDAST
jgi:hypothetical protein